MSATVTRRGASSTDNAGHLGDDTMSGLDSTYRKLCRARHHASELRKLLDAVLDGRGDRIGIHPDSEPTKLVFGVKGPITVPPHVSAALGDYLFNMRAALDHLAWALVPDSAHIKTRRPRQIQFPIQEAAFDGKGKPTPARILGVTDQTVIEAVEAVQPYNAETPQTPRTHPLWLLSQLCNLDKHRELLVAVVALEPLGIWWGASEGDPVPDVRLRVRPVEADEPVAWFDFGDREPRPDFDPHLSLAVRLNEPQLGTYPNQIDVGSLVSIIYTEVEHFVIGDRFSGFFGLGPRHGMTVNAGCDCPALHGDQ